jgi:2-phosphosulfolactate phosphatase
MDKPLKIQRANLETCGLETDFVVVIDVLRAFTTAAVAFAQGAHEIILVSTAEELFSLSSSYPGSLMIGEINGIPIDGVDYGNSPSAIKKVDLSGRSLIQRTTAGTQGVLRSSNARYLLATSLCCLTATLRYIEWVQPSSLTLVESGVFEGGWGDEDKACADLIEARLLKKEIDQEEILDRVAKSKSGEKYRGWENQIFPREDLIIASEIDRYNFAMKVTLESNLHFLRTVK